MIAVHYFYTVLLKIRIKRGDTMKQTVFITGVLILTMVVHIQAKDKYDSITTVESVDLDKYLGKWYEIAVIPNTFQRKCMSGTTAEYAILPDGRIQVNNACTMQNGERVKDQGVARVVDANTNASLEVSFVQFAKRNIFWGDYLIIGLADDYSWAVIGHPKRTFGWILSRTPVMTEENLQECNTILKAQGYNLDNFVMTSQKEHL
jgi:apolipoprotein D and lipocalin family protein